jgi:hypothetical protein
VLRICACVGALADLYSCLEVPGAISNDEVLALSICAMASMGGSTLKSVTTLWAATSEEIVCTQDANPKIRNVSSRMSRARN